MAVSFYKPVVYKYHLHKYIGLAICDTFSSMYSRPTAVIAMPPMPTINCPMSNIMYGSVM
jgi:hypothetical protein